MFILFIFCILILVLIFFFLAHFIFFLFSIQSFNHNLSYVMFFNSVFILLISIFVSHSFVKVSLVFNFIFQSKFMVFYFSRFSSYFFNFFLLKLFFFNLTLQSKLFGHPLIYFLLFSLSIFHHNFFKIFCEIDFFFGFHLETFYLLEIKLYCFFYLWCFRSNNLDHKFEKIL